MNAISASRHRKTNKTLEFPDFYSSHTIHLINKLRTDARNNYEPTYQKKLQDDIQNAIELDKTILIDSLLPNSTRSCFKYLRSFSLNHLLNHMHWKLIKASTNIQTANLFNYYLALYTKQETQHSYQ